MTALNILVFNCGSSSLKFSFFNLTSTVIDDARNEKSPTETTLNTVDMHENVQLKILLTGEVDMADKSLHRFYVKDAQHKLIADEAIAATNYQDAAHHSIEKMAAITMQMPQVIAHRMVHGGVNLRQHCVINDAVMQQLTATIAFAPLHNQTALDVINVTRKKYSHLAQVVCFDTAFHVTMPPLATILPIAKRLQSMGIQRYGFHGLSCESIIAQLKRPLPEKCIIAHLGNGASITAVKNGQSVDTSMGLTPSGGIMMGSRSGDIDPGVLIYLMREKHYDLAHIAQLINHESGLLGVSGVSSDMRILHQSAKTNADAASAIALFCASVAKQIAAMATVLNGVDVMVFTGGIGENDALTRATICEKLAFLGFSLDAIKNQAMPDEYAANIISDAKSAVSVLVVESNENAQIARHAWGLTSHLAHASAFNCPTQGR